MFNYSMEEWGGLVVAIVASIIAISGLFYYKEDVHNRITSFIERRGGVVATVISAVIFIMSVCFWGWLTGENDERNGEAARNVILSIGGVWAIYAVFLATIRVRVMQQQQVSESLAKAAEQLSSDVMPIRTLAILSLGKIAVESGKEICQDVVAVLCVYICEKYPAKGQGNTPFFSGKSPMPEDIRKILNVLSGIKTATKASWIIPMDLSNINLSGANLWYANLSGANLWYANLSGANLSGADLSGANLLVANLSGANLSDTDLSGANLSGASLSDANLSGANLLGANLSDANLSDANLSGADLSGANLLDAKLRYANLSGADLGHADLGHADLERADLPEVKGLDTVKNLETVNNTPQEIEAEIERREANDHR